MFKSETKKRIKVLGLLIVILSTSFTILNLCNNEFSTNYSTISNEDDDNAHIVQTINPKVADYSKYFNRTIGNIDLLLHQSLINSSQQIFNNLDNSNKFTQISPDNNFKTFYMNMTIEDIEAPNKSIIYQDLGSNIQSIYNKDFATSFDIIDSCYLKNVSVYLYNPTNLINGSLNLKIYNSTWDPNAGVAGASKPDVQIGPPVATDVQIYNFTGWFTFNDTNKYLDILNTQNKTFFIVLNDTAETTAWYWDYDEGPSSSDGSDDVDCWSDEGPGTGWQLIRKNDGLADRTIDFRLRCSFYPEDNTPKPTDINMQVNNTPVSDINGINKGNWISMKKIQGIDQKLEFYITADWWDVSCKLSRSQINYTKTGIQGTYNFTLIKNAVNVNWTVDVNEVIDDFELAFANYYINFTIPATWYDIRAFNGSIADEKIVDISGPIINRYKNVTIVDAGNGTNWYLTAASNNLIQSIDMYKGLDKVTKANYSDIISFAASFTENIDPGLNGVNLSVYSPELLNDKLNFTRKNITFSGKSKIYFDDWIVNTTITDYGVFRVQVFWNNQTAAAFFEDTITIFADTQLRLISPEDGGSYFNNQQFNITVYYNDTGQDAPIEFATIDHNSTVPLIFYPNGTAGYYTTEINTVDFIEYGWHYIKINATKTYFNNDSFIFSFQKIINTKIIPDNIKDFGDVIKGKNVTYVFNYSDVNDDFIEGAEIIEVDIDPTFIWSWTPIGQGNYSIELDSTNVDASASYICNFSISATGNETQIISLQLTVVMTQTLIDIQSYNASLIRKDHLNQTVIFYFNDTDNNEVITGLTNDKVIVTDNQTGSSRLKWLYAMGTPGLYKLNISTSNLNSGWISFNINASLPPNYNESLTSIQFYLRGNLTQIPKISLSDPGGQGTLKPNANNYSIFEERDLYVEFNITDIDYNNNLITSEVDSYSIEYFEIGNTSNQGILTEDLSFDANTNSFKGYISTTDLPKIGSYTLTLRVRKVNYEEADISFNIIINARYNVELSIVSKPDEITAGDTFKIILKAQYDNGTLMPLVDANIILIPYFDDSAQESKTKSTNDTGEVLFEITVSRTARNISLNIQIEGDYYHLDTSLQITDITVNPPPGGLTFKDLMPYLIIIGAAIAVVGASLGVYRGVVVPKKREKARVLTEVKTIFDDAINLEHVLVLHKGTGTCIYFKSFGSEAIDPELISGFISAISSFGKDLVSQEELNEISYGDKMLLLSDGEFIRIALVLSKKASIILRKNLKDLIIAFERRYENELPKWRGQLNIFREADTLIDDSLNTSIILPHEITYEFSTIKALKISHSRDVLKIANGLIKDSERNFFFIATLLKEASEKSSKDTAEIFMGIKELRDKKILMPIEISAIEAPPISQQEINLINQKVAGLVDLSPEEKQKLVNDLAQMGPAEREAYFASLAEQKEIISAPIETKPGAALIENMKDAKKEIAKLKKIAKDAKKKNDYENAIKINQNAAQIALNWELSREFTILDDTIRKIKIEDLKIKLKDLENEAKNAAKEDNYKEAAQKYKMSSKIASEIFKLGVTDMTKEVKRLSNKSKEYEKLV